MKDSELRITSAALGALATGDLENFLVAATPGGIEAQEKAGQTALVNSDMLPIQLLGCTWDDLKRIGIVRREQVDDLFVKVELPPGWTKRATDHDMHSKLYDEKGRIRFNIFYKAAFYDRRADMSTECRYCATSMPVNGWDDWDGPWYGAVLDGNTVVWHTNEQTTGKNYDVKDSLAQEATDWLNEHYPDWRNPFAYWD